jgi:hypothetical protein
MQIRAARTKMFKKIVSLIPVIAAHTYTERARENLYPWLPSGDTFRLQIKHQSCEKSNTLPSQYTSYLSTILHAGSDYSYRL